MNIKRKSAITLAHLLTLFLSCAGYAYDFSTSDIAVEGVGIRNIIAVDQDDHVVHVVFYDQYQKALKHALLEAPGVWRFSTVDDTQNMTNFDLDFHVDSKGTAHLAYVRNNSELIYAERKGTLWYKRTVYTWTNSWAQSRLVSISADLQGHPYIAFSADFHHLQLAYEDRDTPYPYSWTMLSPQGYRMSRYGIDIAISQAGAIAEPTVHMVYLQYGAKQIKLVSYDPSTANLSEDVALDLETSFPVNPGLGYQPPYSISYAEANGSHHIAFLWVDDPASPCFSCGDSSAYYLHSTPAGWTTPEKLAVPGFPINIRHLGDIKVNSANEPVLAAVGASDVNVHVARKTNGSWIVESTNYGYSRNIHQIQTALDACDNLHVSGHDSSSYYELEDDNLIHIVGLADPNNNGCVIQPDEPDNPGYSGSGLNQCRTVQTSYLKLPRLECDFLAHIAARLNVCHISGHCSFASQQGFMHKSTARSTNYSRVSGMITDLLTRENWFTETEMLLLRESLRALLEERGLLDKPTGLLLDQLYVDVGKSSTAHILAKLMHKVSLAESLPEPMQVKIPQAEWTSASLGKIAWLSMRDVIRAGKVSLEIVDEREKIRPPNNGTVLWPAAIYRFGFGGAQATTGYSDITIDFSGLGYSDPSKVRLYEVRKNHVRDMTIHVDPDRGTVTGRVDRLGSYVLVENP